MSSPANKPTVSYTLFMHREELKRHKTRYLPLNKTKKALTNELISKNVRNFRYQHLKSIITLKLLFKKKLKKEIVRMEKLQNLGIENPNPNAESTEL